MMSRWRMMIFLALFLATTLTPGTAGAATERSADGQTRVLVTTFPLWLMARRVAADVPGVAVDLMIPADRGARTDYGLTPRDMMLLSGADVLIMNGLGLEAFLGPDAGTVAARLKPGGRVIAAAEGVPDILPDEDGTRANPHLFASPRMAALLVKNIGAGLAEADPAHADRYLNNAESYAVTLDALADAFAALGARLANPRVVTQHRDFDYLARDAGLNIVGVVRPHEGQEPSAADLLRLTRLIREENVGAVFTEPQYPAKAGETLARETGVPLAVLDPVANGPADASPDYYERVMENNLRTLERTLDAR